MPEPYFVPPFIQLHPDDTVGILTRPVRQGEALDTDGRVMAQTDIPAMHKLALRNMAAGSPVIKYQQIIGFADRDIRAGEHVHVHNCSCGKFTRDYEFATALVEPVPLNEPATFMGYRRPNGTVGTRNYIGIVTPVNCSATVARQIADAFRDPGRMAAFQNVDGVVALVHNSGCGMAGSGDGFEVLARTLYGFAAHPNFAGVLILGLGCEVMQIPRLISDYGLVPSDMLRAMTIQQSGGTRKTVEAGIAIIEDMLPRANALRREPVPQARSGLACNVAAPMPIRGSPPTRLWVLPLIFWCAMVAPPYCPKRPNFMAPNTC